MKRFFWFGRHHPVFIVVLVCAVILTSASAVWAVNYDQAASQRLLPGTMINGVPVGGLSFDLAVARVREQVEAPLHHPIKVQSEEFEAETTAWNLGLQVDVPSVVDKAMNRSKEGNLPERIWRQLFSHGPTKTSATPKWGDGELGAILERAGESVTLEPQNASISTSTGWVTFSEAKVGRQLDVEASRNALLDAVRLRQDTVRLVTQEVQPEVGADAYSKVLLVRAGENTLSLYENGAITKSWPVATGTAEFPTPTGNWRIIQKLVNPVWTNPNSSWSKSMPPTIPGGPGNPLGTHALALNASGILIHATSDDASIGYSASHGCIRMHESDELDVFGRVSTGTTVAIVNAGPAKARGSSTPAPETPTQAAAVQF
ncbi:MAG TPA: L,D-transpeptidase/peptidoglycan binding protein [Acidimicrobiales bacterium]|nr:L,D-transpeptidase/peptidoglycan binding protein [Acidimicrobiales bacterium]